MWSRSLSSCTPPWGSFALLASAGCGGGDNEPAEFIGGSGTVCRLCAARVAMLLFVLRSAG